jgi:minor extracellular serine protease Vpr
VGATTNSHVLYAGVIVPGRDAPTRLLNTLFGDGPKLAAPLIAPLGDVSQLQNNGRACTALPPKSLAGAIALVERGDCAFSVKVSTAENAGARAVVIVESAGNELPFTPTGLGTTGIPAVTVGNTDGAVLQNFARTQPGQPVTLDPAAHGVDATSDVVASFSSRGPVIWTGAIKPDLVAPGADLYTAAQSYDRNGDVYDATGFTAVSGTSFATGLIAGAAALVKQSHPAFTPGQIKSALVNTTSSQVLDNGATASVTAMGAGKLDAGAAVGTPMTVEPATVSFGDIGGSNIVPVSVPLKLTNVTNAPIQVNIEVQPTVQDPLARVTVSPGSLQIPPGQTQVMAQLMGGQPSPGSYEGFVLIHSGSATLRIPYLYVVGDGNAGNVLPLAGAGFTGSVNDQGFFLILKVIDRYGVAVPGDSVVFNVASGDGVITANDAGTDVLGIAAAMVNLGSQLGDQIFTADVAGFHVEFDGLARQRPAFNTGGVVNAASYLVGGGLAAGSYAAIYGTGLSEVTSVASTAQLPIALAGVSVSFDAPALSIPGHLYFVSPSQVNVQIPWEFQGLSSVTMKVGVGGRPSAIYTLPLASASPAAFEIPDSTGSRVIFAARDKNFQVISSANPARRNETVSLYCNGLGAVDTTPASGDPTAPEPLANTRVMPKVKIGNVDAPVKFSGLSPGSVGLYQINVTVPAQAPTGLQPVIMTINGIDSKASNLPVQ